MSDHEVLATSSARSQRTTILQSPRLLPREQAERSFRASDKEAWLRIAEEWMKLAQTREEPVDGVVGALSRTR
jgi:hypothetical protein